MSGPPSSGDRDRIDSIPETDGDPVVSLDRFAEQSRTKYIGMVRRWIRRFHIDETGLSAEDAVNGAWVVVCQRVRNGSLSPIHIPEGFENVFTPILRQYLVDHCRQERARKRARMGKWRRVHVSQDILDMRESTGPRAEQLVIGEKQIEWLLAILDRQDPSLRTMVVLKMEGFSNEQAASSLQRSVKTVERWLREVRSILRDHIDEDR
jgi:RNA polymerase sigma factor (sigma-70 family)